MPVSPRALVDLILLGPAGDRRQLQDSPVLGDVWLAFATNPKRRIDLLITPHRDHAAGPVAKIVTKALQKLDAPGYDKREAKVAYLQGLVAAKLSFRELLCAIVPRTYWWKDRKMEEKLLSATAEEVLLRNLDQVILWAKAAQDDERMNFAQRFAQFSAIDRYVALAGVILWAGESDAAKLGLDSLADLDGSREIVKMLQEVLAQIIDARIPAEERGVIWLISLNRKAVPALEKSVPAVKGDAARTLFKVKCDEIRWAVLDSGIDSSHEALTERPEEGKRNQASRGSSEPTIFVISARSSASITRTLMQRDSRSDSLNYSSAAPRRTGRTRSAT